jgi:hypothetical protein
MRADIVLHTPPTQTGRRAKPQGLTKHRIQVGQLHCNISCAEAVGVADSMIAQHVTSILCIVVQEVQ